MRKLEQIYEDDALSHRAKAVYIYLYGRADREGKSPYDLSREAMAEIRRIKERFDRLA